MDKHKDDKYSDEPTQVRSIIKQLNEDKPSKVKSREVVIRADGTKVIRVTKKRRVMLTENDKSRKSRKHFLMVLLFLFLLCALGVGIFFVRLASMTGESYVAGQVEQLRQVWGASSVRVVGSGVSGNDFHLDSLVLSFPEDSMVERVEFNGIAAELSASSFIAGRLSGDLIRVKRINIQLREGAKRLSFPLRHGDDLWDFRRVECLDFNLVFGENGKSPVSVESSYAYMYYPDNAFRDVCVFCLKGGLLKMAGWKKIHINEGKFNVSKVAIEDFAISGTTDSMVGQTLESAVTELSMFGSIRDQGMLAGPYTFDSNNMPFTEFTAGKFQFFLTAKTVSVPKAKEKSKALISLPFDSPGPVFRGDFSLKQLTVTEFPAIVKLVEHITPQKRKLYTPPVIQRALATLDEVDGALALRIDEGQASERDVLDIKCDISVDGANQLQGTFAFGLPAVLTHEEYPDGIADPIFAESAGMAWLTVQVGGAANHPQDDSDILEARAVEARKSRPQRIPFERIDVDRMLESMRNSGEMQGNAESLPKPNESQIDLDRRNRDNPFDTGTGEKDKNPLQLDGGEEDNGFAPLSPF